MGEEPGICPKICEHGGGEEAIAWNFRWAKKKPFPMTIAVKKPLSGESVGRRNRQPS
jgi:hypothetical protein